MPLDRHAKRFLDMVAMGAVPDGGELTPQGMRDAMLRLARTVDAKNVPMGRIENRALPSPGGPLPVRIYTPADIGDSESAGIVYFHGGAGVFCSIETHDGVCRMLANASGCRVISVEYRLAPEHPFPAAVEDSYFATQWVAENARHIGIDRRRIAVGGDSAGGTLAAVVTQMARNARGPDIALQVLICPVTDLSAESESRKAYAQGYFLGRRTLEWAATQYCPPGAELRDPRISPLRAADFSGLPPAHIHTARYDPMLDEGRAYADALSDAGVSVRYICHEGMIHHFYAMAGAIPYARVAIAAVGASVREALTYEPQRGTKNSL
jgi:acetyl esterase